MLYRRFGRTNWNASEIGYGMWRLAGWKGSVPEEIDRSLILSVEQGCNFFDTAWAHAEGKSEQILAKLLKRYPEKNCMLPLKSPLKILHGHPSQLLLWSNVFLHPTLLNTPKKV